MTSRPLTDEDLLGMQETAEVHLASDVGGPLARDVLLLLAEVRRLHAAEEPELARRRGYKLGFVIGVVMGLSIAQLVWVLVSS